MDELVKQITKRLRIFFAIFWILPVIIVILGECGVEYVGLYADDVRARYITESAVILLSAVCVPFSLKFFSYILAKKIDRVSLTEALHLYSFWSIVRLLILAIPVLIGFSVYYLMLSTTGLLCGFIGLTASLFCIPGEKRLRKELHIDEEEE